MPARAALDPTRRRARFGILAAAVCALAVTSSTACSGATTENESSIVKTTTMVAGAGVVGLGRDTSAACSLPTPPDADDGGPKRIVVLSTHALDTTCALGVWESVVGATSENGGRPTFLGKGISAIPSVGTEAEPDLDKIAELKPDLILGTQPPRPETVTELQAIAPTTFDNVAGGWRQQFIAGATALGRTQAGQQALLDFQRQAAELGTEVGSSQTEASLVRFTADSARLEGNDTFAGGILGDAGVRRPASQRGASEELNTDDPKAADGDLIYVVFADEAGKEHGTDVMTSSAWEKLGAVDDHRLFTVDDAVWNGSGLTAARALLDDLRGSLNGYTS